MELANDLIAMVNNLAAELAQVRAERDALVEVMRELSEAEEFGRIFPRAQGSVVRMLARIASGEPAPKDDAKGGAR